jgi:redox-sensing transcriptional repressor
VDDVEPGARELPAATVARLPRYLEALGAAADEGLATMSSSALAARLGANAASVRKDLAALGSHGTRGVGYDVAGLTLRISDVLGLAADRAVIIVGAGNLGTALASYDGFARRGFAIAAVVDADPARIGADVGGHRVEDADDLATIVAARDVSVAVLAVPADRAAGAADALVAAGVRAILNFTPTHLEVPAGVAVRSVDLSTELQVLSFYGARAPEGSVRSSDSRMRASGSGR